MIKVSVCHHGVARPQVANEGTTSSMEGSCELLNKQAGTADKEWSSSLGVGQDSKNFLP
jgi:hypothetical protein